MKPPLCRITALIAVPFGIWAQGDMAQRLALVQEAIERDQAALRTYTWRQQTQILCNGEMKSERVYAVTIGPDGKPLKTSLSLPSPSPEGRRLRRATIEKKAEELKN